jgi:hypothetical protein
MTVFTWKGEKDTIMTQWTPFVITNIFYNLDLAMEPQTGNKKPG